MNKRYFIIIAIIISAALAAGVGYSQNKKQHSPDYQFSQLREAYQTRPLFSNVAESLKKNLELLHADPKNTDAMIAIGTKLYVLEDYSAALTWYQKAQQINPNLAHYNASQANVYLGRFKDAELELVTAIDINSLDYNAYLALDTLYTIQMKDKQEIMEQIYKEAILAHPNDDFFKSALNDFYRRTNQEGKTVK